MDSNESNIIIYNTMDGKASVVLYARDGSVWMNQNQLAELFDTSKQGIGQHIANILNERELDLRFWTDVCFPQYIRHKKR